MLSPPINTGVVHHWNGTDWSTTVAPDGAARLVRIWGNGPNNIYAVGDKGAFLHFNGNVWRAMRTIGMTEPGIVDVSGHIDGDAMAVGGDGSFWRISP